MLRKIKLKLSLAQLRTLTFYLGAYAKADSMVTNDLLTMACVEFGIKRNMQYNQKLLMPKKNYKLSLTVMETYFLNEILTTTQTSDPWVQNLIESICWEINRQTV
jgi:hypothetical protein